MENEQIKYYFYYYEFLGTIFSGKRVSDTCETPQTFQSHEISKDDFDHLELNELAVKFPNNGLMPLT